MSAMKELVAIAGEHDTQVTVASLACVLDPETAYDVGRDLRQCDVAHGLFTLLSQLGMRESALAMDTGHAHRHEGNGGACNAFQPVDQASIDQFMDDHFVLVHVR